MAALSYKQPKTHKVLTHYDLSALPQVFASDILFGASAIKHLFVIGNVRYKMRWTQTIIPPLFPLERATGQSHKTLTAVCETMFSYPAGRQAKSFNNLLSRVMLTE